MNETELIEQLADKEHAGWAHWMEYLFSKCNRNEKGELVIPEPLIWHWQWQIDTPYADLSEKERQSDRDEVAKIMPIIEEHLKQATVAISNAQMAQGVRLHPNAMMRTIEGNEA
jgi:hypothetical protein